MATKTALKRETEVLTEIPTIARGRSNEFYQLWQDEVNAIVAELTPGQVAVYRDQPAGTASKLNKNFGLDFPIKAVSRDVNKEANTADLYVQVLS